MTDIPKIVSARLQAAASIDAPLSAVHPDTEMLGAFAEQALSVSEREHILGHLALCADCREVLALAMPPDPVATSASVPLQPELRFQPELREEGRSKYGRGILAPTAAGKNWWFGFARPNLGWAALAAGVAVAASMLVLHPLQQKQAVAPAAHQVAAAAPTPSADGSRVDSASAESSAESNTTASLKSKPGLASKENKKLPDPVLTARNVAPIEKAKPVLQSEEKLEAGNQPSSEQRDALRQAPVRWQIADGILRRSSNAGENWENVLHADHPLRCYASHDRDIWAGGQKNSLFHSADSGQTWTKIQISTSTEAPESEIARIDLRWNGAAAANEIVVSNKAMETWSSVDGGATWHKQ
jgi:hypothetical protein